MTNQEIKRLAKKNGLKAFEASNLSLFSPTLAACYKNSKFLFVESTKIAGPREDYYSYLVFVDGELVAIGDEQENYAERLPEELKSFIISGKL